MNPRKTTIAILAALSVSLALADDITLSNGKVLHNAKIINQDAASVTIKHSTGIARVMIPELPPELRTKLNYDPDNARAALEKEQREISALSVQRAAELAQSKLSESQEKQYQAAVELWQKSLVTITGKIQQITEDGIYLYRENDTHPVFIKHADPGGVYVDGDIVSIKAAPCAAYQYGNVRGSSSTVRAFDAAPPPRPTQEEKGRGEVLGNHR